MATVAQLDQQDVGKTHPSAQKSLLDPAIVSVLEEGDVPFQVNRYGVSIWAETSRIDCENGEGEYRSYFLKTLTTDNAAERVLGEYESMLALYTALPSMVPKPRGHGQCLEQPKRYFYVCDYIAITHELPEPVRLGSKLAELHRNSESPNGKFGFHCITFDGDQPTTTTWDDSWTSFFKRRIYEAWQLDIERNGHWDKMDEVLPIALDQLIPRLLDALTSDGRTITPTLIHGDLWESNIGTDEEGEICIYDACAYYAHHEKEVAIWRCEHHKMTDEKYRREYFKNNPPSEPREEVDDRNRLYAVETLMNNGLSFPGAKTRRLAVEDLQYLVNKYVPQASPLSL